MKYILLLSICLTLSTASAQTATYYYKDSSGVKIELGELICARDSLGNVKYIPLAEILKLGGHPETPSKKQDETLLKVTLFTFLGLLAGALLTR